MAIRWKQVVQRKNENVKDSPTAADGVNAITNANQPLLSAQMLAVLRLLDLERLTPRQLNDRLFNSTPHQSRRVFAASMSRTVRRLEQRGLIFRGNGAIVITQHGEFTLHPEILQGMLDDLRTSVRQAVAEAWAEYQQSQDSPALG
jgi:hypothetical protein